MLKFSETINHAFQQTQGDSGTLTPEFARWIMKLNLLGALRYLQQKYTHAKPEQYF